MAATAAGAALTETHRLAQARLGRSVVRQMAGMWPLLDPADLDGTVERWLRLVLPVLERNHDQSARLAAAYLRTFRTIEAPDLPPVQLPPPPAFVPAQAATSLTVTGPVAVKSATARGLALADASDLGLARSASAAMRHTLNGGRDTIRSDSQATGWTRALSGDPCEFCQGLAADAEAGDDSAAFVTHDGCGCEPVPAYR